MFNTQIPAYVKDFISVLTNYPYSHANGDIIHVGLPLTQTDQNNQYKLDCKVKSDLTANVEFVAELISKVGVDENGNIVYQAGLYAFSNGKLMCHALIYAHTEVSPVNNQLHLCIKQCWLDHPIEFTGDQAYNTFSEIVAVEFWEGV